MHEPPAGKVYAIYYPVLAAVGIPVNIVAIAVLSRGKCSLSKCITWYLVAMAAADLLVVIFGVIFNRIVGIYFPGNYLSITPICRIKTILVFATTDSSVWLTVAFTFDRFIAICCQELKAKYCTEDTAAAIVGVVLVLSYLKNIPLYFMLEPLYKINDFPWYCRIRPVYYISPFWQAYSYFGRIVTPFLPFVIILFLNAVTVRYIFVSNKIRRALRSNPGTERGLDPETENRRKSIILLFSISANFILLWLTFTIHYLYYRITTTRSYTGYDDPIYILEETGYMFMLLSCCTNTFIYVVTQKKFREELTKTLKIPLHQIVKCAHK